MILHVLIAMVASWLQRHQQQVITYLLAENRGLKAQLGGHRLRLTDTERRRLAALAHPLGRQRLTELATLVTPDTLLRWYKHLIAQKFDGSQQQRALGRPRVAAEVEQLVIRMAAVQCPRSFYTDLDTFICKRLPQTDWRREQHTSRLRQPAIAWHAPHGTAQRQRQQNSLQDWDVAVVLAPPGSDVCDPSLSGIIPTRIGHYHVLPLLHAHHIVIHPDFYPVAPQALLHIEAKIVAPNLPILPDGPRPLAEA
jgi:hypothetical protein